MPETKKNPADKPQQKQPGRGSDQPGHKSGSQKQPGQSGQRDKDERR